MEQNQNVANENVPATETQTPESPNAKRDKLLNLIFSIALFVGIALMFILTIFSYATVKTYDFENLLEEGAAIKKSNMTLYTLAFTKDGLIGVITDAVKALENSQSIGGAIMSVAFSIIRCLGLIVMGVVTLIISIVILIKGIVNISKMRSEKLAVNLASFVRLGLVNLVIFSVFTVYDDTYGAGIGMIVGIALAIVLLLAAAVVKFIFNRQAIVEQSGGVNVLCRSLSSYVFNLVIFIALATLHLYSCFTAPMLQLEWLAELHADSSAAQPVSICLTFSMVLLVMAAVCFGRAIGGFTRSGKYLYTLGTEENKNKPVGQGFIGLIVLSAIALICAIVVTQDKYKVYETGNILGVIIAVLILSIVGEVAWIVFNKINFSKKKAVAASAESAPVADNTQAEVKEEPTVNTTDDAANS